MFLGLLSGDGTVVAESTTRAQLPLLLAQAPNLITIPVGLATETDAALPISFVLSGAMVIQVGQAIETDSALAISMVSDGTTSIPVGLAVETDEALPITFTASGDVFIQVGMAVETDIAFPISFTRTFIAPHEDDVASLIAHVDRTDLTLTPVEVE